tara:strand:+ start:203 stop:421 length:219 start_codon:yes stop_codon:yes gene_type:complete
MNNVLFHSIEEFIISFLYALALVCPLQWVLVLFGVLVEFEIDAALIVSAILALINLCIVLYYIKLLDEEYDD